MRWLAWVVAAGLTGTGWGASTLDRVRTAKALVCGVNTEEGDYSRSDDHGVREAFDRDVCRAVAVAILGAEARIVVKAFPDDGTGMEALRAGAVDLLPTLTKDFTHTTGTRIGFSGVVLWDGVGFMVPVASGIVQAKELTGKKVCLLDGTEVEETVRAWFRHEGLSENPFPFQEEGEMEAAFATGGCAAMAGDRTRLSAIRVGFGPIGGKFRVLRETISKDPLAAAYRRDDDGRFGETVDWVVEVLVGAEEAGMTKGLAQSLPQASMDEPPTGWDMTMRRMTGKTHELGARLGLEDDWAVKVVSAVGNYGEIFDRDLGIGSPMEMERDLNRLQRNGGLMVGLPIK